MRLCVMLLALALHLPATAAAADPAGFYPQQPVTIVLPFGAGSGPDFAMRTLQPALAQALKQSVIIENRPGANGAIGTRAVALSAADGYTLLGASTGFSTLAGTTAKLGFDPINSFAPIGLSAESAGYLLVVKASSPFATMQDLIAAGKKSQLFYGSPGTGNTLHLVAALFAKRTKTPFKHVAYSNLADAVLAAARGEVTFVFATLPAVLGQLQSGELRAIGYAGSAPLPEMPSVPLVSSVVPGFHLAEPWAGLLAPANTSAAAVSSLSDALKHAAADERYKTSLQAAGYTAAWSSPAVFKAFLQQNIADWREAAAAAGLRP
jgi:tripartite-type tricarboxylate transporter receptor subunit TctC